jgi:hypothetical protein
VTGVAAVIGVAAVKGVAAVIRGAAGHLEVAVIRGVAVIGVAAGHLEVAVIRGVAVIGLAAGHLAVVVLHWVEEVECLVAAAALREGARRLGEAQLVEVVSSSLHEQRLVGVMPATSGRCDAGKGTV